MVSGPGSGAASLLWFRRRPAGGRPPQKRASSPGGCARLWCGLGVSFLGCLILTDPVGASLPKPCGAGAADGGSAA